MRLFSVPNNSVDKYDRSSWLSAPFDLSYFLITYPVDRNFEINIENIKNISFTNILNCSNQIAILHLVIIEIENTLKILSEQVNDIENLNRVINIGILDQDFISNISYSSSPINFDTLVKKMNILTVNLEYLGNNLIRLNKTLNIEYISYLSTISILNLGMSSAFILSSILDIESSKQILLNKIINIENLLFANKYYTLSIDNQLLNLANFSLNPEFLKEYFIENILDTSNITNYSRIFINSLDWLSDINIGVSLDNEFILGIRQNNIIPMCWGGIENSLDKIWVLDSRQRIWIYDIRSKIWKLNNRSRTWGL
jgi:hypothetical protein